MNKVILIVDYNNVFTADQHSSDSIEQTFSAVVNAILTTYNDVDSILIRIYAGWYQGQQLTARGSAIMAKLGTINPFPNVFEGRQVYGNIEIASQLYGVNKIWYNTYREKEGPRLLVNKDMDRTHCRNNKENCPLEILTKFTKKNERVCSTPGCTIQNKQVLIQYGQKMVDTMMACDVLSYAEDIDTKAIFVLSDDVDLFPAIVLSRCKNPDVDICIGTRNNLHTDDYNELDFNYNIKTFLLT